MDTNTWCFIANVSTDRFIGHKLPISNYVSPNLGAAGILFLKDNIEKILDVLNASIVRTLPIEDRGSITFDLVEIDYIPVPVSEPSSEPEPDSTGDTNMFFDFDSTSDTNIFFDFDPTGETSYISKSIIESLKLFSDEYTFRIINPHGTFYDPLNTLPKDKEIVIVNWSVPVQPLIKQRDFTEINITGKAIKLKPGQNDYLKPIDYLPCVFDNNGFPIANIINNHIYILFDLFHDRNGVEVILPFIVDQAIIFMSDPDAAAKVIDDLKEKEKNKARDVYVTACTNRTKSLIVNAKRIKEESLRRIEVLYSEIISLHRTALDQIKLVEVHSQDASIVTERYKAEYDKLITHPFMEKLVVDTNYLMIFTKHVYIDSEGMRYDIGKFKIKISLNGGEGREGIRIYNLTHTVRDGNYFHPHIQSSGSCCWGNLANAITELMVHYEFSVLFNIIVQYLHSYNPDDAYTSIRGFPSKEIPKEEVNNVKA